MTLPSFNRRALLQSGALAAGTLAASGFFSGTPQAAIAPGGGAAPLEGALVAWVLLHPEAEAEIRLAHLDAKGRLLGQAPLLRVAAKELTEQGRRLSAWGQMRQACARAQIRAIGVAAHSWGVPAQGCEVRPRRIVHQAAGRSIGYGVWADMT